MFTYSQLSPICFQPLTNSCKYMRIYIINAYNKYKRYQYYVQYITKIAMIYVTKW